MRDRHPSPGEYHAIRLAVTAAIAFVFSTHPGLATGVTEVVQKGRMFLVRDVRIARGEVLRFVNGDEYPHQINIRGPGMNFDSNLQEPSETIDVLFPGDGSYEVRCGVHPRMRMTVNVTAEERQSFSAR